MDPTVQTAASVAAERRQDRERAQRGMDPIDHTLEHAGNPDHELDMMPDSLTEDR